MPKLIERWQCETCGGVFSTIQRARNCESTQPSLYPVGCIYGDHSAAPWHGSSTFAVALNFVRGHYNRGEIWMCAPRGLNPTTVTVPFAQKPDHGLNLGPKDGKVRAYMPTFQRMVEWLRTQDITPTVWDGHKSILLEEFLIMEAKSMSGGV